MILNHNQYQATQKALFQFKQARRQITANPDMHITERHMIERKSEMSNDDSKCPVSPPKLLKAESLVTTCASCGAWVERCPAFLGEMDGYWQCDKCGNTSVKIREGRPYGAKSREWANVVQQFEELCFDIPFWEWETITTEPLMKDLDWKAVETWYRSRNIHRMFIAGGEILEFKAEG